MAKYSKAAQQKVEKTMQEMNEGVLKSGNSDKPVKSRKQAIAIGLSEARKQGSKVPSVNHSAQGKSLPGVKSGAKTTKRKPAKSK